MRLYSSTYTFSLFDKQYHLIKRASEIALHKIKIPKSAMDMHIFEIDKNVNIPVKKSVLTDFNSGAIEVYLTDDDFIFPSSIPVVLRKDDTHKIVAQINLTPYASIEKDNFGEIKSITINDNLLMTLLCTAWFYRRWSLDETKFSSNVQIVKTCAEMYAKMIFRVLKFEYSADSTFEAIDQIHANAAYFFANYFATSKYASEIAKTIPSIVDKNNASKAVDLAVAKFKEFKDFKDFISLINTTVKNLNNVDDLKFVSGFGKLFNGNAAPAIDFLPFFVMLLFSTYLSGGLGKDIAVASIVKNGCDDFIKYVSLIYK